MSRKVLLVGEELETLKPLGAMLQRMKFKVAVAQDSAEARRMTTKYLFDMVFVDMDCATLDCVEFAKRTRQSQRYLKVPVVLLADSGDKTRIHKARGVGLGLVLYKPFETNALKRVLLMALGGCKAQFSTINGHEVFEINCATDSSEEINKLLDVCAKQIRKRPPKSVVTLTTLVNGVYNNELVAKLSDLAKGNEPYVRKAAIVGLSGIYQTGLTAVSIFSRRDFKVCTTKEEALSYLTAG
ncbi:MAG: hypothetical protein C0624_10095 [Desulfuromonas sp.]|nr:MAG: hypothetical protein C0624_10095 [Desulfuromonas sp.]